MLPNAEARLSGETWLHHVGGEDRVRGAEAGPNTAAASENIVP